MGKKMRWQPITGRGFGQRGFENWCLSVGAGAPQDISGPIIVDVARGYEQVV